MAIDDFSRVFHIGEQVGQTETIHSLFDTTGFWDAIRSDPFSRVEWIEAVKLAPTVKKEF